MISDEDDLSKDIAAAFESVETPPLREDATPGAAADAPTEDKAPAATERARDETGKFVKKDDTETPAAAKDKNELAPAATATGAQQQAPKTPAIAPPTNWKGNGKVEWNRLPQHIQKEIADDYTRLTETQGRLQRLESAIGDRGTVLAAQYGSVEQGLQNLFAISDFATKNPQGFVLWYAQQRGIDLSQLVGQGAQQGQDPASQPNPLEREIHNLKNQLQQLVTQQQTKGQEQLQTEIERFAADPAHPYFNDVRPDMAALMQAGRAKDMQQAYDMAIWARPEIRDQLLDAERKKAQDANTAKVAAARQAAGTSINGAPIGAKTPHDEPDEDLEATVRRSVDRAYAA